MNSEGSAVLYRHIIQRRARRYARGIPPLKELAAGLCGCIDELVPSKAEGVSSGSRGLHNSLCLQQQRQHTGIHTHTQKTFEVLTTDTNPSHPVMHSHAH